MADFPTQDAAATPSFVNTFSLFAPGLYRGHVIAGGLAPAQITWVANLAVFMPVNLPWPYPVRRVFWANGGTVAASNADFGIYNWDGVRLYSTGSTALSGASAMQTTDPTDFVLPAGRYYFAYNCDNTTARAYGTTALTTIMLRQTGVLQQAVGAVTLPATMASAGAATQALYNLCGITRMSTGF
jgi:hypothetical protein